MFRLSRVIFRPYEEQIQDYLSVSCTLGSQALTKLWCDYYNSILLLLLLLLLLFVFSPWAGLGRDQISVRRLVWLWYVASWASS